MLFGLGLLGSSLLGCQRDSLSTPWLLSRAGEHAPRNPVWSQDGDWIVFNDGINIYAVASNGGALQPLSDPAPDGHVYGDVAPSISPDGTRIALSTYRFTPRVLLDDSRNFEIATVSMNGSDVRRLTKRIGLDSNPVWSPDGKYIAFVSTRIPAHLDQDPPESAYPRRHVNTYVMTADGSEPKVVTSPVESTFDSPVWSPDGQRVAFLAEVEPTEIAAPAIKVLHTVRVDGTDLRRISESTLRPAWSPDGSSIAFGIQVPQSARVYVSRADGSNSREVTKPARYRRIYDLSWSPDGSEIRFVGERVGPSARGEEERVKGIYAVSADGLRDRVLAKLSQLHPVAWSPDDSRIAIFVHSRNTARGSYPDSNELLYTIASDGSEIRILMRVGICGLVAENSNWRESHDDLLSCADGFVVREPKRNPGLVFDCQILIKSRNALAGVNAPLLWNSDIPISDWVGVKILGDPLRVRRLSIPGSLAGTIPPQLGYLDALKFLNMMDGRLSGSIPNELGCLDELSALSLDENSVTGAIPPGLGRLTKLRQLHLRGNGSSGGIPPELGNLANLNYLGPARNQLTGDVPSELGGLANLESLGLDRDKNHRLHTSRNTIPPISQGLQPRWVSAMLRG